MPRKRKQKRTKGIASSKPEKEIKEFLQKKGFKVITQFSLNKFKFDLFIEDYNTLIEFNGDYYHCNPELYEENYKNEKLNLLAHQIWKKDEKKKLLAENNGYQVIVVWEKDYKESKLKTLNSIIKQLNK